MNLEEYRQYILASRKNSAAQAMSVLSATISTNTEKKEGSK